MPNILSCWCPMVQLPFGDDAVEIGRGPLHDEVFMCCQEATGEAPVRPASERGVRANG